MTFHFHSIRFRLELGFLPRVISGRWWTDGSYGACVVYRGWHYIQMGAEIWAFDTVSERCQIFHKVVLQQIYGAVGSLKIALLQI